MWEPKSINGGAPKYSVSLIIPKSDKVTLEKIDEKFLRQHYNMSYDKPIDFILKINSKWFTFLYDAFGKFATVSKINSKGNECEVKGGHRDYI